MIKIRQYNIETILEHLFSLQYNYLCKVEVVLEAPNTNNPPYASTNTNNIPIQIHALMGQDRVNRAILYDENVSHEAFLELTEDIVIGGQIVLTHKYLESGETEILEDSAQKTYKIIGITEITGLPQPMEQMQLDLVEK